MKLTIIRGVPGSGKTTMAKAMGLDHHYEADMWFDENGGFDRKKLSAAHSWCQSKVRAALDGDEDCVVSNTFTRHWEMEPYIKHAQGVGAEVEVKVASGTFKNVHGVPESVVEQMRQRFEV